MLRATLALFALVLALVAPASATVLSGALVHLGPYEYPSGTVDVEWSGHNDTAAWFYGTVFHSASATSDVYDAGVLDPLTVADASMFPYSTDYILVHEGETVFIRGQNGDYAAWVIDDIGPTYTYPEPWTGYIERGTWYYQDDHTASFTPEPSTGALVALGLVAIAARRPRSRLRARAAHLEQLLADPHALAREWTGCARQADVRAI
jgi:hypothetical protein